MQLDNDERKVTDSVCWKLEEKRNNLVEEIFSLTNNKVRKFFGLTFQVLLIT